MKLLLRLVEGIERIAVALEARNTPDEATVLMAEQIAQANAMNKRAIKQREDWQEVEREHMKVCERRYHALMSGEPDDKPVSH